MQLVQPLIECPYNTIIMKYVLIFIFGLWWLWIPILVGLWSLIHRIIDSVEDREIRKSGIEIETKNLSKQFISKADEWIQHSKSDYFSLKTEAFLRLPGLENRITRDKKKTDYINRVLPYKKKNSSYKRTNWYVYKR